MESNTQLKDKLRPHLNLTKVFEKTSIYLQLSLVRRIGSIIVSAFYSIMIYRVTGSFVDIIIGISLYYIGCFVCLPPLLKLAHRLNYLHLIKIGLFIEMLTYLGGVLFFAHMDVYIYIFGIATGIAIGVYSAGNNMYLLEEVDIAERSSLSFLLEGISSILATILPIFTGFLIIDRGYQYSLGITVLLYAFAMFIPTKVKTSSNPDVFKWSEFRLMTKLKGFWQYSLYALGEATVSQVRDYALLMVPFLLLGKSEINVGVLSGVGALLAGITGVLIHRTKKSRRLAVFAAITFWLAYLWLGLDWTAVAVAGSSLIITMGSPFFAACDNALTICNMQSLLGHHLHEDAVELLIYREALLFLARMTGALIFLGLLSTGIDFLVLCRTLILILAGWQLLDLLFKIYFDGRLIAWKHRSQ